MNKGTILLPILIALLLCSCLRNAPTSGDTSPESSSQQIETSQSSATLTSTILNTNTNTTVQDIEDLELLVRERIEDQYPEIYKLQRLTIGSDNSGFIDARYQVTRIDIYRRQSSEDKVSVTEEAILKHILPIHVQGVYTIEPVGSTCDYVFDIYCADNSVLSFVQEDDRSFILNQYKDKVFLVRDKIDVLPVAFLYPMVTYPDDSLIIKMALSRIMKRGDTVIINEYLTNTLISEFDAQKIQTNKPSIDISQPLEDLHFYFGGEVINMRLYDKFVLIVEKNNIIWYKIDDVSTILNSFYSIP